MIYIDEHIRELLVNDPIVFPKLNEDSIVKSVIDSFKERSEAGFKKYGTNLDRNDLSVLEWLSHAQQEAMDFTLYLEKLKSTLGQEKKETSYPLIKVKNVSISSPNGTFYFRSADEVVLKYSLDGTELTLQIK